MGINGRGPASSMSARKEIKNPVVGVRNPTQGRLFQLWNKSQEKPVNARRLSGSKVEVAD